LRWRGCDLLVEAFSRDADVFSREAQFIEQIACRGERRIAAEGNGWKRFDCLPGMSGAEKKMIRRGAPDERCATGFQKRETGLVQAEAVNNDGAFIERASTIEIPYFVRASGVGTLGEMENEWLVRRSVLCRGECICVHRERVSPVEITQDADRKVIFKYVCMIRIVVADGGDAGKQIANSAPPEPRFFGNGTVLANGGAIGMVDIVCPLGEILVATLSEAREQGEFEMIVRVDQAGKNEVAIQIQRGRIWWSSGSRARWRSAERADSVAINTEIHRDAFLRAKGNARAANAFDQLL